MGATLWALSATSMVSAQAPAPPIVPQQQLLPHQPQPLQPPHPPPPQPQLSAQQPQPQLQLLQPPAQQQLAAAQLAQHPVDQLLVSPVSSHSHSLGSPTTAVLIGSMEANLLAPLGAPQRLIQ